MKVKALLATLFSIMLVCGSAIFANAQTNPSDNKPKATDRQKDNDREDGNAASELRYEKTHSNIVEVKSRDGIILSILTEGDKMSSKVSDHVIEIPETSDLLAPILSIVPLQLLAYHIAVRRGCDVDQPRNLAKSVTVE